MSAQPTRVDGFTEIAAGRPWFHLPSFSGFKQRYVWRQFNFEYHSCTARIWQWHCYSLLRSGWRDKSRHCVQASTHLFKKFKKYHIRKGTCQNQNRTPTLWTRLATIMSRNEAPERVQEEDVAKFLGKFEASYRKFMINILVYFMLNSILEPMGIQRGSGSQNTLFEFFGHRALLFYTLSSLSHAIFFKWKLYCLHHLPVLTKRILTFDRHPLTVKIGMTTARTMKNGETDVLLACRRVVRGGWRQQNDTRLVQRHGFPSRVLPYFRRYKQVRLIRQSKIFLFILFQRNVCLSFVRELYLLSLLTAGEEIRFDSDTESVTESDSEEDPFFEPKETVMTKLTLASFGVGAEESSETETESEDGSEDAFPFSVERVRILWLWIWDDDINVD